MLRDEPEAVPGAVEELLRYLSVVHTALPRLVTGDVSIGATEVREGDLVAVSLPTANRDPELTDRGDDLDVRRPPTNHVAFGNGIHPCLGAPLARAETQIAFQALFQRFAGLALAGDGAASYREQTFIYGLTELLVTW